MTGSRRAGQGEAVRRRRLELQAESDAFLEELNKYEVRPWALREASGLWQRLFCSRAVLQIPSGGCSCMVFRSPI